MTSCPSCRGRVDPSDRFCSNCGTPLSTPCPTCGTGVSAGAAVCTTCGAEIDIGPATIEYRLVTAMYVDLVGSTGLAEALDPEDFAAVMTAVGDAVRTAVTQRAGAVGAFIGDGVLGVFGLPAAHEDDPTRALHSAQAVLTEISAVNADIGGRFGVDIAVRIGINTGELLAPIGEDPELGTLTGDVLNVAARLQELAGSGSIVVSERTSRSAPGFRFRDLGLLDIRGRARPVHGFEVVGEADVASLGLRAPLHGRVDEQETLRSIYRRTEAEGSPHLVTVIGNAGVGKSRLVREFVEWAERADAALTTVSGRCLPYGEDLTYRPLLDVLSDLTGATSSTPVDEAAEAINVLVRRYVDHEEPDFVVAALLRMIGVEIDDEAPPTPRRIRELLHAAWRLLMTGLASGGPVIVVVEDIHWAGDALLEILEHVVAQSEGPLLIIAPARPELLDREPGWGTGESATMLMLGPLQDDQAERLAGHLLADAALPVTEAKRVTERAGGNPLFIEELVRELSIRKADDSDEEVGPELPATIQGVLSARMDLLERPERRTLQAASVIGRIFRPSTVQAMTGYGREEIDAILNRLEALQLIRPNMKPRSGGESEFIFQHVLTREAAYSRLSRRDLAHMHAAAAEWLTESDATGAEEAERLAYHTWKAHDSARGTSGIADGDVEALRTLAVERLLTAAARAREKAAFGRASQLADLALGLAVTAREAADAHEQLGLTGLARYDGDAAWRSLTAAIDLHLEGPEPDRGAVARLAALAVETPLRWGGMVRQLPPMHEVLQYVDIGIENAGSDDSEPLATLLTALAFAPMRPGPEGARAREVIGIDEGLAAGLRAREIAQRLDLPRLESGALDALQAHALWGGRVQEAAEIATRRLEIVDSISDPWEVGDTHAMAAQLAFDLGRYSLARDRAHHGYEKTHQAAVSGAMHNLAVLTTARLETGEWDGVAGAIKTIQKLLDPDRGTRLPTYATPVYAAAALVAACRGKTAETDHLLAVLEEVWRDSDWAGRGGHPLARWTRHTGPIYIRRGEFDTVRDFVVSDDAQPFGREGDRLGVWCELVAAERNWDEADDAIDETRAVAAAYGVDVLIAHADRLEGRSSIAQGDRKGGIALLSAARERFDSVGAHWEAARTGLDVAEAGADIDVDYLRRFFEGIGAVDEMSRTARLASDGTRSEAIPRA